MLVKAMPTRIPSKGLENEVRMRRKTGSSRSGDTAADYYDRDGNVNTYYAYLKMLNNHHTMPVVISEYGVSTGRGMAQRDINTGRNQGHMTEQEQGQAAEQGKDIENSHFGFPHFDLTCYFPTL